MKTKIKKSKHTGNKVPEIHHKKDNLTIVISLPRHKSLPKRNTLDDMRRLSIDFANLILSGRLFRNVGTTSKQKVVEESDATVQEFSASLSGISISFFVPESWSQKMPKSGKEPFPMHCNFCAGLRWSSAFLTETLINLTRPSLAHHKALLETLHTGRNNCDVTLSERLAKLNSDAALHSERLDKLTKKIKKIKLN